MFRGRFNLNLDGKGRISIPSKFREILTVNYTNELVLTFFVDGCLAVFPMKEWLAFEAKTREFSSMKRDVRTFWRLLNAGLNECTMDKQGRVLIPSEMKERAGIVKEAVLLGMNNRFEIWSKQRWEGFYEGSKDTYEEVAEKLSAIGF